MAAGVCAPLQQSARAHALHVAAVQLAEAEAEAEARVFVRNDAGLTRSVQHRGRRGRGLRSLAAGKAGCARRAAGIRGEDVVCDSYGFFFREKISGYGGVKRIDDGASEGRDGQRRWNREGGGGQGRRRNWAPRGINTAGRGGEEEEEEGRFSLAAARQPPAVGKDGSRWVVGGRRREGRKGGGGEWTAVRQRRGSSGGCPPHAYTTRANERMCAPPPSLPSLLLPPTTRHGVHRRVTRGNKLHEVIVSSSMAANLHPLETENEEEEEEEEEEEGEEEEYGQESLANEGLAEGHHHHHHHQQQQQDQQQQQQQDQQQQQQDPLLVRVARGEAAERTPVWLMRQAGRYMAEFRKFSDKLPFRHRSETADIAIELSLQPWRAFRPDGVIMFSDILTPLPALGIDFDVIKGKGPLIGNPVRSLDAVHLLRPLDDPESSLPFIREILSTLRKEVATRGEGGGGGGGVDGTFSPPAVIGFIGTPWTLAAYAMEGSADRNLIKTKRIMMTEPDILHALLQHLADALTAYVIYQIESGAQVVQLFDSWAHHLSPSQFAKFSLPYAEQVISAVKKVHPKVPLIFHANGGAGKLHLMRQSSADVLGLDWWMDMRETRRELGPDKVLQGNVDPMVLFGREEVIRNAVADCFEAAGRGRHILNVGHGVIQGTPEESVKLFCDLARQSGGAKGVST